MSLTLQFALNCFKTYCLDIKIQAIKGTKFSSSIEKSILGCFHPFQNPTGTWILGMILRWYLVHYIQFSKLKLVSWSSLIRKFNSVSRLHHCNCLPVTVCGSSANSSCRTIWQETSVIPPKWNVFVEMNCQNRSKEYWNYKVSQIGW